MKFLEFYQPPRRFLIEMNVANEDELARSLADMLDQTVRQRGGNLDAAVRALFLKRVLKAMKNDERGSMVEIEPVTSVADDAPAWLRTALDSGKEVVRLAPNREFVAQKLPHVVDWLLADPDPLRALRAAPEADLMNQLHAAADRFFAQASAATAPEATAGLDDEPGREVIMTFRALDGERPRAFLESDLSPNPNGPVVAFWAKLTSPEALNQEGKRMSHCVGSYAQVVAQERSTIYSLRDASNQPHVTVEIDQTRARPLLVQLKGKGNRPPVGKYAGYIKEFLNALNVHADYQGANDLRGVGLFTHEGRYGDLEEINATVVEKFANGDTIRLHKVPIKTQNHYLQYSKPFDVTFYYIEKGGTVPFQFEIDEKDGSIADGRIRSLRITRDEISRYPVYVKNIMTFLEKHRITPGDRTLEHFGLYTNNGKVGPLKEVADRVFASGGVTAYAITPATRDGNSYEAVFIGADDVPFLTVTETKPPRNGRHGLGMIKVTNRESKFARDIPALLLGYFNAIKLDYGELHKDKKELLRNHGVIWSPHKKQYFSASTSSAEVFRSPKGAIKSIGNRLYLFDASDALLAEIDVRDGNAITCYGDDHWRNGLLTWSDAALPLALELLRQLSAANGAYRFEGFTARVFLDLGFVVRNARLIAAKELEQFKMPKGMTLATQVNPHSTEYEITDGGEKYTVRVDANGVVTEISEDPERIEHLRQRAKRGETIVPVNRERRLLALKALKLKMPKSKLLSYGFRLAGGKVAAIKDRETDLWSYRKGSMPLTDKLMFKTYNGNTPIPNGNIRIVDEDSYGYHDNVARVEAEADGDIKLSIRKRLPDGVTRADVHKAMVKFLEFYHDKLEPMIGEDLAEF